MDFPVTRCHLLRVEGFLSPLELVIDQKSLIDMTSNHKFIFSFELCLLCKYFSGLW